MEGTNALLGILSQVVQGVSYCRFETCYDDDFYCCNGYCCGDDRGVYEMWWFWFIWVIVFLFIVSCAICIRRRRAARLRYVRIAEVPPTGYSSVTVATSNQFQHTTTPPYYQQPTAPQSYPNQPYNPQPYPPPYQQSNIPKTAPPAYQ